jgi:hypothetical protein
MRKSITVTNQAGKGQLVIGASGLGTFTQSGGTVTVDRLSATNAFFTTNVILTGSDFISSIEPRWTQVVTNFFYSTVSINSGLFNTKSTTVSNTQTFVIGDGIGAANFHLLGGVHSFANGVRVRNNAVLSGCGTIIGSVVVDAGGSVLAGCGGTLTFTGVITNNGILHANNGSVLESYNEVVNNGVIDVVDGNTNFHSGFVNNGVVVTADNIPRIISISRFGSDVTISFTTFSNLRHFVEYSTDLTSQSWAPFSSFIGSCGMTNVTDAGAAALPQRFYRIHLQVPP